MSEEKHLIQSEERDINEIFDEIVLIEDRLYNAGYKEGFEVGSDQGNHEGYTLGYSQGVQLGQELGEIYGLVVAEQQRKHTEKVERTLRQLRKSIDDFPRDNDPEKDIVGAIENIRSQYKHLRAMLGSNKHKTGNSEVLTKNKDLSF